MLLYNLTIFEYSSNTGPANGNTCRSLGRSNSFPISLTREFRPLVPQLGIDIGISFKETNLKIYIYRLELMPQINKRLVEIKFVCDKIVSNVRNQ